ncbi:Major facilitator superfamily protein [Theobroma cacao]|uniref:Major facilitator superfamily protein n=1 Tax=Theobroma cacao TaxID=3641 RepID=A0A061DZI5_THECC|nr:Major facilitator superfamily protein [Theobroma cacao]
MCIFLCMGGNSTTWMNTAVLVTCIRNFRRNRGPVSGILKGYVGLSTAIFTDLCSALFSNDPAKFLIMLAVIPFAVCLTAIFFLREIPQTASVAAEKEETRYFAIFNIVAVVVAVYLLAYDFIVSVYSFVKSWLLVGFEADKERQEPLLKEEATEARKAEIVAEEEEEVAAAAVAAEVEVAVVEKSRILN